MGSSALRGMAYGKPVIVVGEAGFAKALTPESIDYFHYHGFFGRGRGAVDAGRLSDEIVSLIGSATLRQSLGAYALQYVQQHYSLDVVSTQLGEICEEAVRLRPSMVATLWDSFRTGAIYLRERRFLWRAPVQPLTPLVLSGAAVPKERAGSG